MHYRSFFRLGLLVATSACFAPRNGVSAEPLAKEEEAALISGLLDMSAPAPDWREHLKKRMAAGWVPPAWPHTVPPDDAPVERLRRYWEYRRDHQEPSVQVRARLLDDCEAHPTRLGDFVSFFRSRTSPCNQ